MIFALTLKFSKVCARVCAFSAISRSSAKFFFLTSDASISSTFGSSYGLSVGCVASSRGFVSETAAGMVKDDGVVTDGAARVSCGKVAVMDCVETVGCIMARRLSCTSIAMGTSFGKGTTSKSSGISGGGSAMISSCSSVSFEAYSMEKDGSSSAVFSFSASSSCSVSTNNSF